MPQTIATRKLPSVSSRIALEPGAEWRLRTPCTRSAWRLVVCAKSCGCSTTIRGGTQAAPCAQAHRPPARSSSREVDVSLALVAQIATERHDLLLACDRVRLRLIEVGASRRERLAKRARRPRHQGAGRSHRPPSPPRTRPGRRLHSRARSRPARLPRGGSRGVPSAPRPNRSGALYAPEALHDVRNRGQEASVCVRDQRAPPASRAPPRPPPGSGSYCRTCSAACTISRSSPRTSRGFQARLPMDDGSRRAVGSAREPRGPRTPHAAVRRPDSARW